MTGKPHEPDCVFAQSGRLATICDYCITARAAYRRGREDAAKAVEKHQGEPGGCCAHAALGEGEQA